MIFHLTGKQKHLSYSTSAYRTFMNVEFPFFNLKILENKRPLKNADFYLSSRKTKIEQKVGFCKGLNNKTCLYTNMNI